MNSEDKKIELLLVDGSALLHRAYHAYPKLTSRDGTLVNAVYGVASILISALTQIDPEYVVVAWDVPKPTFRHKKYVAYKAHRPKTDEELIDQIPMVREMLSSFHISQIEEEGYEADDLLGSMGDKYKSQVDKVVVLTGDQDAMQLVEDKISVLVPGRGGDQQKMYEESDVMEKYGVSSSQIVDYKALIGDPSDNIPGVQGVGPKTAQTLLSEFGDIDNIYERLDEVEEKVSERVRRLLEEGRDSAYLSRELTQIKRDMKIERELEEFLYENVATPEAREFLERVNFKSLISRLYGQDKKKEDDSSQMGLF